MRPSSVEWCSALGAIAVGLWGILQVGGARATPVDLGAAVGDQPAGVHKVHFKYEDIRQDPHEITCELKEEAEDDFGYSLDPQANLRELDDMLRARITALVGDLAEHLEHKVSHDTPDSPGRECAIDWKYRLGGDWEKFYARVPADDRGRALALRQALEGEALKTIGSEALSAFLRERGFESRPCKRNPKLRELFPAYKPLAEKGRKELANCYRELVREAKLADEEDQRKILNHLLAIIINMPEVLPPTPENGRCQAGFWVPTKVIRRGSGDCESKATALFALWQQPDRQVALVARPGAGSQCFADEINEIRLPAEGHMFLAIEHKAGERLPETYCQIGLRQYVLHEMLSGKVEPNPPCTNNDYHLVRDPWFSYCMTDDCEGPQRPITLGAAP